MKTHATHMYIYIPVDMSPIWRQGRNKSRTKEMERDSSCFREI
jgi:hypothetical protein